MSLSYSLQNHWFWGVFEARRSVLLGTPRRTTFYERVILVLVSNIVHQFSNVLTINKDVTNPGSYVTKGVSPSSSLHSGLTMQQLAVFADPSKRIIRKVVRSLVQSFKSEDIEEDKERFINLSPWLNAIVSCLVAAGKRQSALSWMLSAASSRDSSHSSSNATSENTSASNSSSNAIPANLPQSSSNAKSG
ncbi:hypothetical protein V9T40_002375 [Parthenolecanium corni]|uniref:Uncharacterized protein n=1 Tax=Parthenolecanium corni TaxID=536013 RepID=A0AAN9Y4E5_9HEMI